jgi:hypothetical protein
MNHFLLCRPYFCYFCFFWSHGCVTAALVMFAAAAAAAAAVIADVDVVYMLLLAQEY